MSNQKHFFNLFIGMGLNVILGVITTPIITRLVNPEDYGELSLFTLFGNVFILVAMLGHDQAYTRFYYAKEEDKYKKYVLGATAKTPIIISIGAAAVILLYYFFVDKRQTLLYPIFAVYVIVLTIGVFSNLTVRLKLRTTLYSLIINMQKLLYVVLVVLAVYLSNLDHLVILAGSTVIAQTAVCLAGILAERESWSPSSFSGKAKSQYGDIVSAKEITQYGFPFIFANLCNWVFTGADKVMIRMFSNGTELGIYASAVSIVGIFSIVTTTFSTIWGPLAVEEYERKNDDRTFFVKACDYVCIVLFAMGGCVVLCKDLIVFLLGAKYREAVFLIPFLTLHPVMYTLSESTAYGINFAKKTNYHIVVSVACCITNIVLNYFLIQEIGSLGAAISTGVSYTLFFILRTRFSCKCFKVDYNVGKIAIMTVMYYIFILYNSYNKIDLVSVIMFVCCVIVTVIMYKKRMIELIQLSLDYVRSVLGKAKNFFN